MAENVILVLAIAAFLLAAMSAGQGWNPKLALPSGQYSLRSLVVLMTVAPPLIALFCLHGDTMLKSLDRLFPPSRSRPTQRQSTQTRFSQSRQTRQSRTRVSVYRQNDQTEARYAEDMAVLHELAGWSSAVFFIAATVLLGTVFYKAHSWQRPPRKSPLTWAVLVVSLLAASAFALFILTHPTLFLPPKDDPFGS